MNKTTIMTNQYFYVNLKTYWNAGCHIYADIQKKKELPKHPIKGDVNIYLVRGEDFDMKSPFTEEKIKKYFEYFENSTFKVLKINDIEMH